MLLHPVRRCYEDSGWTDEDSDCDRRSSDTMQRRILQPERFRVTVALTVLRGSFICMYNYFSCDTTYVASRGIFAFVAVAFSMALRCAWFFSMLLLK